MGIFSEKRSSNLRIWHWFSAVAVFGLMFTYILRKTVFSYKDNAQIIQAKLAEFGIELANERAIEIAKILRDNMWQWHYYLGFLFAALLAFRLYAFVSKKEKFPICKIKEGNTKEFKGAKYAHGAFYVVSIYMAASGLLIYFRESLGVAKESLQLAKELHEWGFWFFAVFVVAHIAGVVKAELTDDKGLVSQMFNGGAKE